MSYLTEARRQSSSNVSICEYISHTQHAWRRPEVNTTLETAFLITKKKEIELADGNLSQYDAQKEKRRKNRTENDVSAASC